MAAEELRKKIIDEIKSKLPNGYCVDMRVFLNKESEPHHSDMYWDRYLNRLYHYKGNLLYDSSGCYISNMDDITSLDILIQVLESMQSQQPIPISDKTVMTLRADYLHWGYKEWESNKHKFRYWLWDGKKKSGPFQIRKKMTLAEACNYVRIKFKDSKFLSFELQEFNGIDNTYYHQGMGEEDLDNIDPKHLVHQLIKED